jgi:uncharacterized protein DUF4124
VPRAASLALAAALAAFVAPGAGAQALYKWTDADGKVQYSDKRPKDFKGPVTIIAPEDPPAAPLPKAPAPAPAKEKAAAAPEQDITAKRRAVRAELWARLVAARDKLDVARKALADGANPQPEEQQVIQQQMKAGPGGMHGLSQARSNCRQVMKDGKATTICPALLAKDSYYERMAGLEIAVRQAEEEVAEAEQAWRRGVD